MGNARVRRIGPHCVFRGESRTSRQTSWRRSSVTMTNGDTAGQVRFLELLGRGVEEVNRHAEALRFFERAIKLAEGNPDCGLPFMGYEGKAQAMISLGKTEEARSVLESAIAKA